jgi:two-component sensor histidine kinase
VFTQLKRNRDLTFWSLHAIGWSAYGISHYLGTLLYDRAPTNYHKVIVAASVAGFIISAPLRYALRALWTRSLPVMAVGALAAAYVTALAWRVAVNMAFKVFMPEEMWMTHVADYFSGTVQAMYLMVCWVGFYYGFRYYESMHLQREAALRASALAQEAQLKMLRYQLNPHFLFNTLNAISTLILDNRNSTANAAVTGLSEFLRHTLDQDPMKKVTISQEIDALNLYLNIEKMRFGERLVVEFAIEEAARNVLVPSLVLQPLIENAIKYAVSPREEGGQIRILGRVVEDKLVLEVADNGPGMVDPSRLANGRGVGIRNTRERLNVLYGQSGTVLVENTHPGLRVSLSFPAERSSWVEPPQEASPRGSRVHEERKIG